MAHFFSWEGTCVPSVPEKSMQGLQAEEVKPQEHETYTPMVWNEDKDIDYRALASDLYIDDENQALELPSDSPYGSAFALPQIARSAKYNWLFVVLSFRAFGVLYLSMLVQLKLLSYIGK